MAQTCQNIELSGIQMCSEFWIKVSSIQMIVLQWFRVPTVGLSTLGKKTKFHFTIQMIVLQGTVSCATVTCQTVDTPTNDIDIMRPLCLVESQMLDAA